MGQGKMTLEVGGRAPEMPQFSGLRVLVAEDQATSRNMLRRQLLRLGIEARMVESGAQALAALEADRFDLLITDCRMPGLDGFELTRRIRAREAIIGDYLPILALTADAASGEAETCLEAGMDGYLSKPATIPQLAAKIAEMIRQIDLAGLAHLAGDEDPAELRAIIADYVETVDPALRVAQDALSFGDFALVRAAAHAGKGSALSVCAHSLADRWAELETAAKNEDATAAAGAIAGILSGIVVLKSELREMGSLA